MTTPWKGEPLRITMSGKTDQVWMGNRNSPPVMLYNFDPNNIIYAGYQPNLALKAPNTQILPPNFGLTMDGTRTIYVVGPKGAGPLQVTPGAAHPFQLASVTILTPPTGPSEDPSTPPVVHSGFVVAPSVTTAAFSPPANSWLIAIIPVGSLTASSVSFQVTNTGIALSWGTVIGITNFFTPSQGACGIFGAFNANAQNNITVTATNTDNTVASELVLALRVVVNANSNQSGAANGSIQVVSANNPVVAITPTKIGSLIYVCAGQVGGNAETPTSGTTDTGDLIDAVNSNSLMTGKATMNSQTLLSTNYGWSSGAANNYSAVAQEIVP